LSSDFGKAKDSHLLILGDQLVAFQFGFCFENRYEDWRGAFDLRHSSLSVGNTLTRFVLENQSNEGTTEFDFLRCIYAYKSKWYYIIREFVEIRAVNRHNIIALFRFIWTPQMKRRIKN